MHFKGLDLNLLVVLDVLLAEKNTTRAGEKLFIGQPAVSGALARLRDYFGDQILMPSGRKMVLTSFAESLVQPVHEVLETIEELISRTTAFDPATSTRTFTLNMSDIPATLIAANSLKIIRQLAPGVQLEIVTLHERISSLIEEGEVDFVVVPEMLLSPLHPSDVLLEDSYVCIAWSGNTRLKDGLSLEKFLSMGHVTTRMLRRQEHMGDLLFQKSGLKLRYELVVPTWGMVPVAVVETDMIAVINRKIAHYYANQMPIKIYPVPVESPVAKWFLQWNRYHDSDHGTQWLRKRIVDTIRGVST